MVRDNLMISLDYADFCIRMDPCTARLKYKQKQVKMDT